MQPPTADDDNPFGAPRGAWGRQPPTTFGPSLGAVARPPARPSNLIRRPMPGAAAPRGILQGGMIPAAPPRVAAETPAAPQGPAPKPATPEAGAVLANESILARTSARSAGHPLLIAGGGVLMAAGLAAALLLLHDAPAATATPRPIPTPIAVETPVAAKPAVGPASIAPAPASAPRPLKARPRTLAETPPPVPAEAAPISPPPITVPPIVAPAEALPADPDAPMATRTPG